MPNAAPWMMNLLEVDVQNEKFMNIHILIIELYSCIYINNIYDMYIYIYEYIDMAVCQNLVPL